MAIRNVYIRDVTRQSHCNWYLCLKLKFKASFIIVNECRILLFYFPFLCESLFIKLYLCHFSSFPDCEISIVFNSVGSQWGTLIKYFTILRGTGYGTCVVKQTKYYARIGRQNFPVSFPLAYNSFVYKFVI